MASKNDQQFDDDLMLQRALQMSLEQPSTPAAVVTAEKTAPEATEAQLTDSSPAPADKEVLSSSTGMAADSAAVSPAQDSPVEIEKTVNAAPKESPKKKKKKKNSYANMMTEIMKPKMTDEDKERELAEKMNKSLGGGTFSKLDKI